MERGGSSRNVVVCEVIGCGDALIGRGVFGCVVSDKFGQVLRFVQVGIVMRVVFYGCSGGQCELRYSAVLSWNQNPNSSSPGCTLDSRISEPSICCISCDSRIIWMVDTNSHSEKTSTLVLDTELLTRAGNGDTSS